MKHIPATTLRLLAAASVYLMLISGCTVEYVPTDPDVVVNGDGSGPSGPPSAELGFYFTDDYTKFAEGDRVGVGVFVETCMECDNCNAGLENYCVKGFVPTYNSKSYDGEVMYGGYSTSIVVDDHYVYIGDDGHAHDHGCGCAMCSHKEDDWDETAFV